MLRTNRLMPTLVCLLLGVCGCVSSPKPDTEARRLAALASENHDWGQAMGLWNSVLEGRRGQDAEARLHLGEALLEEGRGLGAIKILRVELPTPGTELKYGLLLARAHFSQKQARAGRQVLNALLTEHAGNVEVLTLYGKSLLGGDWEAKGLGLLLQALRVDRGPGHLAEDVAMRARALNLRDMEGEAWTLRLESAEPPVEAYVGAAEWAIYKAEQGGTEPPPSTALHLTVAVKLDPLNGRAWTLIGGLRSSRDEHVEARQAYREALSVDPGNWAACLALARSFAEAGDCIEAKVWTQYALGTLQGELDREPFEELEADCE